MDVYEVARYSVTSFVMSFLIMEVVSPYISSFYKEYTFLSVDSKIDWNSRVLSFIHATVVFLLATTTVFTWDFPNHFVGGHQFSFNTVAITTGYMAADMILMLVYKKKIGASLGMYVHHISALSCYAICLLKENMVYFICFKLITEGSTPFLNLRLMASILNKKNSKLYKYNGLMLIAVFFLCRILVIPFFYYQVYKAMNTTVYKAAFPGLKRYVLICLSFAIDALNLFWFEKIVKGALKYFINKSPNDKLKKY